MVMPVSLDSCLRGNDVRCVGMTNAAETLNFQRKPLEITNFAFGIKFDESLLPVPAVSVLSATVAGSLALAVLRPYIQHLYIEKKLYRIFDLLFVRQLVNLKIVRILMFRTVITLLRYYRTQNYLVGFQLQINLGNVFLSWHCIVVW